MQIPTVIWPLLLLGLCLGTWGCTDAMSSKDDNADSDTGKQNGNDTGKPGDSDTGKQNGNDTGKPGDSDTGKQNGNDTGKQSESDSDNGPDTDTNTPDTSDPLTWVDETTGLEWQVTPPEKGMEAWYAMKYCEDLDLNGRQDWRLPNLSELRSLIRGCPATETGGACPLTSECLDIEGGSCYTDGGPTGQCLGCPMAEEGDCYSPNQLRGCSTYWSISPQANSSVYYRIRFSNASIDFSHVSQEHTSGVRCVRGG
ncbi:MAG: DUF1566 domain-containing protein [Proteobacteria bacterium]|nr:DUF1566 domain-containing protein [Pseudomonadota bacterium]